MKNSTIFKILVGSLIFAISSCNNKANFNPQQYLSPKEMDAFKYKISRYIGRLPKHSTEENKHDAQFNEAYNNQARLFTLSKYYKEDNTDTIYFEVNKLARSLKFKKVAIGGKMVLDNKDANNILYYEECYRTWKMDTTTLNERTAIIFKDLINKQSLQKYYTAYTNDATHIEFPNQNTYYNTKERKWTTSLHTFNFE